MRRIITAVFVLGALALLLWPAPELEAVSQQSVPVNVRIQCNGETVGDVDIQPYTAVLRRGQNATARFRLLGNSDVSTVTVRPKEGVEWPFDGNPPSFGQGNDASTGAIRSDVADDVYGYDFIVTCGTDPDTVDPNMDIRP
ncbi:MAG: hypothetical protein GKS06_12075 [Acidobacteria bacterium]|nr:hypothetical protein [Acidobacteriota bacterium]